MYSEKIYRIARHFALLLLCYLQSISLISQDGFTYFNIGLFEDGKSYIGNAVVQANGGFYLFGDIAVSNSESDIVLHYLDEKGQLQWTDTVVANGEYFEAGISLGGQMILTSDNNLVLAYTVADEAIFGHHNVVVRKINFEGRIFGILRPIRIM